MLRRSGYRLGYTSVILALCVMTLLSVRSFSLAQDALPTLPPVEAPPTFTPEGMIATLPPAEGQTAPEDALGVEALEALPIVLAARADLDLLARDRLPEGTLPAGWSGSTNVANPQLALLLRLDLEILTDALLGASVRPPEWVGVVVSVPIAFARDIRHDLEYLADAVIGGSTIRPGGWRGDDPLYKCSRVTQNLLFVLETRHEFILDLDFARPDLCVEIERQINTHVEAQMLQPSLEVVTAALENQPYVVASPFVIAFGDINARQRFGVLPVGTGFTPIGRSGNRFSNMMVVSGANFQVFVDYTYTPLTTAEFELLPVLVDGTNPPISCNADWCNQ